MSQWRAMHEWVDAADGRPDAGALERAAGRGAAVTVTDTRRQQTGAGPCVDTTLGDYLDWWRARRRGDKPCPTSPPSALLSQQPDAVWYLKDFHLVAAAAALRAAQDGDGAAARSPATEEAESGAPYDVPAYLSSDWLNAHFDMLAQQQEEQQRRRVRGPESAGDGGPGEGGGVRCSDYRFVYLGPAGSWTPLHSDVLRSNSWSGNVAGTKRCVGGWPPTSLPQPPVLPLTRSVCAAHTGCCRCRGTHPCACVCVPCAPCTLSSRWLLLPPEHTHLLYDRTMSTLAPDFGVPFTPPPAAAGAQHQQQQQQRGAVQQPPAEDPELAAHFPALHLAREHLYEVIQVGLSALLSGWVVPVACAAWRVRGAVCCVWRGCAAGGWGAALCAQRLAPHGAQRDGRAVHQPQ